MNCEEKKLGSGPLNFIVVFQLFRLHQLRFVSTYFVLVLLSQEYSYKVTILFLKDLSHEFDFKTLLVKNSMLKGTILTLSVL